MGLVASATELPLQIGTLFYATVQLLKLCWVRGVGALMSQGMSGAARPSHYSTTEQMLVGAIKEQQEQQQQQQQASATRSTRRRAAAREASGGSAERQRSSSTKKRQPAEVSQVKPRRRKATRAQKQSVADLDNFDPSASSKRDSVKLPALVPPGRSRSVLAEAPKLRVGIEAPSPDRFRSQSVDPVAAALDSTMVWSPPHPTELLDRRTDLRTMFANGASPSASLVCLFVWLARSDVLLTHDHPCLRNSQDRHSQAPIHDQREANRAGRGDELAVRPGGSVAPLRRWPSASMEPPYWLRRHQRPERRSVTSTDT